MSSVNWGSSQSKSPFKWKWAPSDTDADRICILDGWATQHITSWACEPLGRWTHGKSRIVTMNHEVREDFEALWAKWEKEGLINALRIPAWGGGWVPRYKRGAPRDMNPCHLSAHSSGHAFDICPAQYPLKMQVGPEDPIHALASAAAECKFKWGGDFIGRKDPMHFQHLSCPFP